MSVISSWDFVDPKLAARFVELESANQKIKTEKNKIQLDSLLPVGRKSRLLQRTREAQDHIKDLLTKQKQRLLDYYDKQIIVNTKEKHYSTQLSNTALQNKICATSKIAEQCMDKDSSMANQIQIIKSNPTSSWKQDESTVDQSKILGDHYKSTSRYRSTHSSTLGSQHYQHVSIQEFSIPKRKMGYRGRCGMRHRRQIKRRNYIIRCLLRQVHQMKESRKEYSQEQDSSRILTQSMAGDELSELRERERQNEEYIQLLKAKLAKVTEYYESREKTLNSTLQQYLVKLEQISEDEAKIQKLQQENFSLRLQRDQLMNMIRKLV